MVLTDTTWWGIHLISRSLDYLVVFPGLARFRGPRIRVLNQTETPVRVLLVFHQSGSPGGRPRVLADVQDLARQRTGDAIETLAKIMANEKAPLRRASRLPRCCSIALCQASTAHRTDARRLDPTALNDDELAVPRRRDA